MRKFLKNITAAVIIGILMLNVFPYNVGLFSGLYKVLGIDETSFVCAEEFFVVKDKRACWVSFLDLEEYLVDLDENSYRAELDKMYDTILANNMNTIIFHVRPMCDAVYPSDFFPWSTCIRTDRSAPPYDPLYIALTMAHEKGLSFEAWINPYRVSRNYETTLSYQNTEYYDLYKDLIVEYNNYDGELCLSLDPAKKESVELICNGVAEIVENYDVDGIHFDDYFYVDGLYDELSVSEKMSNVNYMISSVYETIKNINPECEFGISPSGNMDNARDDGADIDTWLSSDGYIDYIMPQLYWADDYVTTDNEAVNLFSERCDAWQNINILDKPIYAGLALYKVGVSSSSDVGWTLYDDNLLRQCQKLYETGYDGFAMFRYANLCYSNTNAELDNLNSYVETISFIADDTGNDMTDDNEDIETIAYNEVKDDSFALVFKDIIIDSENPDILYVTYMKGFGIGSLAIDGRLSVMDGIGKGMDAVGISLNVSDFNEGIEYRVHICGGDWTSWARDGEISKGIGSNGIIDGIQIRLYGQIKDVYDVFYRVGYGGDLFSEWYMDGEIAGNIGMNTYLDSLEIKLETK